MTFDELYEEVCNLWDTVWGGDASNFHGIPDQYNWLQKTYDIDELDDIVWQLIEEVTQSDDGLTMEERSGDEDSYRPLLDNRQSVILFLDVMKRKILKDPAVQGFHVRHCDMCQQGRSLPYEQWYDCNTCVWGKEEFSLTLCKSCADKHQHPTEQWNITRYGT